MHLQYGLHLDDYHSTIDAHGVRSLEFAVSQVQDEVTNGYDVTNVTLDGRPLFCRKCVATGNYNPAETKHSGSVDGLCTTHRHQAEYEAAVGSNRYRGD